MRKKKRNKLERKLDEYNHTMELIRTILPFGILILQVVILMKVMWLLYRRSNMRLLIAIIVVFTVIAIYSNTGLSSTKVMKTTEQLNIVTDFHQIQMTNNCSSCHRQWTIRRIKWAEDFIMQYRLEI